MLVGGYPNYMRRWQWRGYRHISLCQVIKDCHYERNILTKGQHLTGTEHSGTLTSISYLEVGITVDGKEAESSRWK